MDRAGYEDPLVILKRGYTVSIVLALVFFTLAARTMLYVESVSHHALRWRRDPIVCRLLMHGGTSVFAGL